MHTERHGVLLFMNPADTVSPTHLFALSLVRDEAF